MLLLIVHLGGNIRNSRNVQILLIYKLCILFFWFVKITNISIFRCWKYFLCLFLCLSCFVFFLQVKGVRVNVSFFFFLSLSFCLWFLLTTVFAVQNEKSTCKRYNNNNNKSVTTLELLGCQIFPQVSQHYIYIIIQLFLDILYISWLTYH